MQATAQCDNARRTHASVAAGKHCSGGAQKATQRAGYKMPKTSKGYALSINYTLPYGDNYATIIN